MPYDPGLADRLRDALAAQPDVTEKKMFGGLAFLRAGLMTVVANHAGGLMVRTDPADEAELVTSTPAEPVDMQGRPMKGWLVLDASDVADDEELDRWVERAVSFVSTLPPKR